jgi:hypothetical protein
MYYIKYVDMFRAILCSSCSPLSTGALYGRSQRVTYQMLQNTILTSWRWAYYCSKHVEVFNVIHILQNKETVHQVDNKTSFVMSVRPSVCLRVSAQPPPDGFPWNLILQAFIQICRKRPNLVKKGLKYWGLYIETFVRCIVTGDFQLP